MRKLRLSFGAIGSACLLAAGCGFNASEASVRGREPWPKVWVANPFAGTQRIEVEHLRLGGPSPKYVIDDAKAVAELIKAAKITGIWNDVASGCMSSAKIAFVKNDGSIFQLNMECEKSFSVESGILYLHPAFTKLLGRHIDAKAGTKVNLRKMLPELPQPQLLPTAKLSLASLTGGFKEVDVVYNLDKRMRRVRITNADDLETLRKAAEGVSQGPRRQGKYPRPAEGRHFATLTLRTLDGNYLHGNMIEGQEFDSLSALNAIRFKPGFTLALNEIAGRMEARPIDVHSDNGFDARQRGRMEELKKVLADVVGIRLPAKYGTGMFTIDTPAKVTEFLGKMDPLDVPREELKVARKGVAVVELLRKGEPPLRVEYLDTGTSNELVAAAPFVGDLVRIPGFGQVWIKDNWNRELEFYEYELKDAVQAEQKLAAIKVVCQDLPRFFKEVISVEVCHTENGQRLQTIVSADAVRSVLKRLEIVKLEPLNLTSQQWKQRVAALNQTDAVQVTLSPGLGFGLVLIETGKNEALIPFFGRVVLRGGSAGAFADAAAGKGPITLQSRPGDG